MPDLPSAFDLPEPAHTLPPERVAALLHSDLRLGLDEGEAARRLAACGANALPEAAGRGWLARFGAQFANALIVFLLAAAVVALLLGHWVDAA